MTETSPNSGHIYRPFEHTNHVPETSPVTDEDQNALSVLKQAYNIQLDLKAQRIIAPRRTYTNNGPGFTQEFNIQIFETTRSNLLVVKEQTQFELGFSHTTQVEFGYGLDIGVAHDIHQLSLAALIYRSPQSLMSTEFLAFLKWQNGVKTTGSTIPPEEITINPVQEAVNVLKNLSQVLPGTEQI